MSSSDEDLPTTSARNAFLMLGDDGENSEGSDQGEDVPSSTPIVQPQPASVPKPRPASKAADKDIDNLLAELQLDSSSTASDKKSKKKKKKKTASIHNIDVEIDDMIDSVQVSAGAPSPVNNQAPQHSTNGGIDDLLAELASPVAAEETDSKKKKKPKKKKKEPESVPPAAPSKQNAAILALKQRLEAEKRAEEEFQRQEEERLRRIEEKRRQEEEEAKRKEEDRLRKIEEKKRKQEELRRQGKLLTKGQKAKANKDASYIEQLRAQGLLPDKIDRPANGGKPKPKKKPKKLTQKEKFLAEMKASMPDLPDAVHQEEEVAAEADPVQVAVQPEPDTEPEPEPELLEPMPEPEPDLSDQDDIMSEQSSGSVIADWDMDSEDEARLRREKEERRAKRRKLKAHKEKVRMIREREKSERLQREQEQRDKLEAEERSRREMLDAVKPKAGNAKVKAAPALSDSESDSSSERPAAARIDPLREQSKADARLRREKRKEIAMAERSQNNLRSPICCILGHVDTGKTKILDKIRRTKVQDGEAGGITQQIGASYFPMASIIEKTQDLNALQKKQLEFKLPGLLIIDTPGHESFTNLRSRGSSLCDIAILVVDIMHGLEQQTKESLQLLRQKKTPFIVALNKVDRIYGWKADPWAPFNSTLEKQPEHTRDEFEERVRNTITAFAEEGLNCALYYRNADFRKTVSLVPTSAITGEGLPDLLMLLVQLCQHMMSERLQYISELQCTVLEVKIVDGIGTTIDVILSNGYLHVNDTIVVCGLHGPIVTTIRALLTPYPMAELRVKGEYQRLKTVKAAAGIKIAASGLEDAIAGSQLLVAGPDDDIEDLKDEVMTDLASILSKVDKTGRGVCVQASTLGSLEALLQFLSDMKIPVSGIGIGPVHKKDVSKAAIMVDKQPEYAVILAFDVKVSAEARQHAQERAVRIFTADIIYHLFDQFTVYMKEIQTANQAAAESVVIMPCILEIIPDCIFCRKDPILLGVSIKEGILRKGTPLCVHEKGDIVIGEVTGMELNHKEVSEAKAGQQVCVKIEPKQGHASCTYGRQFDHSNLLLSKITRQSIDVLKANFKDYLSQDDWKCVIKLKKLFNIM